MLYIYTDKNDIPKDKKYIHNVEAWFEMPKESTNQIDIILSEIEKGKYYSDSMFIDRFGVNLYCSFLSTGSKAAILVVTREDYVVNMMECGWNVYECLLNNMMPGSIYLPDLSLLDVIDCYNSKLLFSYKGNIYNSIREFKSRRR